MLIQLYSPLIIFKYLKDSSQYSMKIKYEKILFYLGFH